MTERGRGRRFCGSRSRPVEGGERAPAFARDDGDKLRAAATSAETGPPAARLGPPGPPIATSQDRATGGRGKVGRHLFYDSTTPATPMLVEHSAAGFRGPGLKVRDLNCGAGDGLVGLATTARWSLPTPNDEADLVSTLPQTWSESAKTGLDLRAGASADGGRGHGRAGTPPSRRERQGARQHMAAAAHAAAAPPSAPQPKPLPEEPKKIEIRDVTENYLGATPVGTACGGKLAWPRVASLLPMTS